MQVFDTDDTTYINHFQEQGILQTSQDVTTVLFRLSLGTVSEAVFDYRENVRQVLLDTMNSIQEEDDTWHKRFGPYSVDRVTEAMARVSDLVDDMCREVITWWALVPSKEEFAKTVVGKYIQINNDKGTFNKRLWHANRTIEEFRFEKILNKAKIAVNETYAFDRPEPFVKTSYAQHWVNRLGQAIHSIPLVGIVSTVTFQMNSHELARHEMKENMNRMIHFQQYLESRQDSILELTLQSILNDLNKYKAQLDFLALNGLWRQTMMVYQSTQSFSHALYALLNDKQLRNGLLSQTQINEIVNAVNNEQKLSHLAANISALDLFTAPLSYQIMTGLKGSVDIAIKSYLGSKGKTFILYEAKPTAIHVDGKLYELQLDKEYVALSTDIYHGKNRSQSHIVLSQKDLENKCRKTLEGYFCSNLLVLQMPSSSCLGSLVFDSASVGLACKLRRLQTSWQAKNLNSSFWALSSTQPMIAHKICNSKAFKFEIFKTQFAEVANGCTILTDFYTIDSSRVIKVDSISLPDLLANNLKINGMRKSQTLTAVHDQLKSIIRQQEEIRKNKGLMREKWKNAIRAHRTLTNVLNIISMIFMGTIFVTSIVLILLFCGRKQFLRSYNRARVQPLDHMVDQQGNPNESVVLVPQTQRPIAS